MTLRLLRYFLAGLLFVVNSGLYAATVTLSLPKAVEQKHDGKMLPTVATGKPFRVAVKVSKGSKDTGEVDVKGLDNFTVRGRSQATSITVSNGQFSSEKTYNYDVVVNNEGTFTLGPAKVRDQGKVIESAAVTFQAVAKEPVNQQRNQLAVSSDAKVAVSASLDIKEDELVTGQTIQGVLKIVADERVVDLQLGNFQAPGCIIKPLTAGKSKRQLVDGVARQVFRQPFMITAVDAGKRTLGPIQVHYRVQQMSKRQKSNSDGGIHDLFDSFFNAMPRLVQKSLNSNKKIVVVNELPPYDGRVDGVGSFSSFEATVNQQSVNVNEPVTLTLSLTGKANFERIPDPSLSLPDHVRSYKSKTTIVPLSRVDVTSAKKQYEFVVQPKKAGTLRIPAQQFIFYDTQERGYRTLSTKELAIAVEGKAVEVAQEQQQQIKNKTEEGTDDKPAQSTAVQNVDINFIHEEGKACQQQPPALPLWFFIIVFVVLCMLLVWPVLAHKRFGSFKWQQDRDYKRRLNQCIKKLDVYEQHGDARNLYQFFLQFIALKYVCKQQEVNESFILSVLRKEGVAGEKVYEFLDYLNECAGLSFSPHLYDDVMQEKLLKQARYWLLLLNK